MPGVRAKIWWIEDDYERLTKDLNLEVKWLSEAFPSSHIFTSNSFDGYILLDSSFIFIIKLKIYSPLPLSYFTGFSLESEWDHGKHNELAPTTLQSQLSCSQSHQTLSLLGLYAVVLSTEGYSFLGFLHANTSSSMRPSLTIQSKLVSSGFL